MKRGFTIIPFLFLSMFQLSARADISFNYDTSYYKSYRNKFHFCFNTLMKFSNFEVNEADKPENKMGYSPNEGGNLGFGMNYKWIGFNAAFTNGLFNANDSVFGKTKGTNLQFDMFFKQWIFTVNSSIYDGFYWENPDVVYKDWDSGDSVVVRPDIHTFLMGVNGIFAFKKHQHSLRSTFVGTEKQLKSAGSFLLGAHASYYLMTNDSSLLPGEAQADYPNIYRSGDISALSVGIDYGYTYTYVKNNFFANLLLMPGVSLQNAIITDQNSFKTYKKFDSSVKMHFRFGVGWNFDKSYMGLTAIADTYLLKTAFSTRYKYSIGRIKLFYGWRI